MLRNLIVTAAILDETDRVLLSKRSPDKRHGGLWEFPGGKVQDEETCGRAIIREIHEEIGLDIQENCTAPLCFVHEIDHDQEFLILLYIIRVWHGTPEAQEKQPLAWVKKSDLAQYPMPPINGHLVAMLRDVM